MAPSLPITSGDMAAHHSRSVSDGAIEYAAQIHAPEDSSEPRASGPSSFHSAGPSSPTGVAFYSTDGAHNTPDESFGEGASNAQGSPDTDLVSTEHSSLVTAENAQAFFSPEACVFVANLDRTRNRLELVAELERIFGQVGQCWSKVRFDNKGIPVAFVQYKTVEEAEEADRRFHGTLIFDRPCRIEKARAPRTIFVARKDQRRVVLQAVLHQLRTFGEVEHHWSPSITERVLYNLPDGAFVRFKLFQPCQDAVRALRRDPIHNFTLQHISPRQPATTAASILPDIVPNAIYVGDLPYYITESTLEAIFGVYGSIMHIDVRKILRKGVAFAFVYYSDPMSALYAVQYPFPYVSGDHCARVEPKRARFYRPLHQPDIYSHQPMSTGLPFFRGLPDYTYQHNNPDFTPRAGRYWPYYY